MGSTVSQNGRSQVFRGRPSPSTVASVAANMDVIALLRDDEAALRELQAQERLARRECRCLDARLHSIDCALTEILAHKAALIHRRQLANRDLTGVA